jgi:hypothetical protein
VERQRLAIDTASARTVIVVVIIVGDVRDIGDVRVVDVHVAEISAADAIPRKERFTPAQRAPAPAAAEAESE